MKGIVLKNEVWDFLRSVSECMEKTFCPLVEECGITMLQTRILVEIKQTGRHTVGSLGQVIGLTSGNASSMCKKLEQAGFVKRIRDPQDERFVNLTLTDFGDQTIQRIDVALEKKYGAFLESVSKEELREIIAGMNKISSFMQAMSILNEQK